MKLATIKNIKAETWRNENPGEGGESLWAALSTGETVYAGGSGYVLQRGDGCYHSVRYSEEAPKVGDMVVFDPKSPYSRSLTKVVQTGRQWSVSILCGWSDHGRPVVFTGRTPGRALRKARRHFGIR